MNCVTPLGVSIGSRVTIMKEELELSMELSDEPLANCGEEVVEVLNVITVLNVMKS